MANPSWRSSSIASVAHGLYLLDEPEAAPLSPLRQMAPHCGCIALVQARSQLIIATHSPIILAYPHATIYECSPSGLRSVAYEDTEHFRITHDFLNRYPAMLRVLLVGDGESDDASG